MLENAGFPIDHHSLLNSCSDVNDMDADGLPPILLPVAIKTVLCKLDCPPFSNTVAIEWNVVNLERNKRNKKMMIEKKILKRSSQE